MTTTAKHKPAEYAGIKMWGEQLGSFREYIEAEQERASEEGAPIDAIFWSDSRESWQTVSGLACGHPFSIAYLAAGHPLSMSAETAAALPPAVVQDAGNSDPLVWATWYLLTHGLTEATPPHGLPYFCMVRLQKLLGETERAGITPGPRSIVLIGTGGHWSRGANMVEAAKGMLKAGAGRTERVQAVLVLNDDTPEVNQVGEVVSNSASAQLTLGLVGTVASILNAEKGTR